MIDRQLGPYEILEKIGAGGMGEVYRARDTRLDREVAIKVLPSRLCSDPERLRRFEQEARAAGVLNHPNVLAIHDIGTHDGAPYVVSELLEGDTLRVRMGGSALPPRKAIDYAIQVAKGLAAAHQKGIVHRDLKPDNLFLTEDGRIKILDFGLAKLTRPEDSTREATNLPTVAVDTEPGRVMGTIGYMSPEQVRGTEADHRSDIFSLGTILYEMVAGRQAFRRESSVETMNAILKEEPPELSQTNPTLDPSIDRVIRHCLEKSPAERFQSARDLAFDLESLSGSTGASYTLTAPKRRPRLRVGALVAGLILIAAASGLGYWVGTSRRTAEKPSETTYKQITFRRGFIRNARFASDGHTIVYSAAWQGKPIELFSSRTERPGSRALGVQADLLSLSSTGELAILLDRQQQTGWTSFGTLARLPLGGGAPREISEHVQGADWSPDGTRLAVIRWAPDHYSLEYPLGTSIHQTYGWLSAPRVSPDGKRVAFLDHPIRGDNLGFVSVVDAEGKVTRLTEQHSSLAGLAWSRDGSALWFGGTKTGIARSLREVTLSGEERVKAHVPGDYTLQDVHPSGNLLMSQDSPRREFFLMRGDEPHRDLSWLDWSLPIDLSADGETVLFMEQGAGAGEHYVTYLRATDGSDPINLAEGAGLSLSPDKKRVLAMGADLKQLWILPTGAGEPEQVDVAGIEVKMQGTWFPDGKRLLLAGEEKGAGVRLYIKEVGGGPPRAVSQKGVGFSYYTPISPDGKYFAAHVPGEDEFRLYPFDGGEPRSVATGDTTALPLAWSEDGQTIFYSARNPDAIHKVNLDTGERTLLKEIHPANPRGIVDIGPVLITPDGKSIIYGFKRIMSDLFLVEGFE